MGIFKSRNNNTSNQAQNANKGDKTDEILNESFPDIEAEDIKSAKLMTLICLNLSDKILKTDLFNKCSFGDQLTSIAFAKVAYYHLINRFPIENNLFYAFLSYYFWENFDLPLLDIYEAIFHIQKHEHLYLLKYYDYDDNADIARTGNFHFVMKAFYYDLKKSTGSDYESLKNISEEEFAQTIGPIVEKSLSSF